MFVLMLGIMTIAGLIGVLVVCLENESVSERRRLTKSSPSSAAVSRNGWNTPRKAA